MDGLRIRWSKREKDLSFSHDKRAADGHLLYNAFCCEKIAGKTLVEHLEERGFDITTLRFDIKRAAHD